MHYAAGNGPTQITHDVNRRDERRGGSRNHHRACHRSLRVERPASASTTAMIQNRITICGSVQPSCSK